jgi:hypothetical protein
MIIALCHEMERRATNQGGAGSTVSAEASARRPAERDRCRPRRRARRSARPRGGGGHVQGEPGHGDRLIGCGRGEAATVETVASGPGDEHQSAVKNSEPQEPSASRSR